ncbi:MAG: phosphoribosylanthranilate isomerase [bacterium]|nr:phosphoribosylanthranilate isomerase [bacterium]
MPVTRVKICGLTNAEDIQAAAHCGADALGFVLEPSSPRYVGDRADLVDLLRCVPPFIVRVAVFGRLRALSEEVWRQVDAVQFLPGEETPALPLHLRRICAVRLRSEEDVWHALSLQREADALLVDAYHPWKLGGTGDRADWELARRLREEARVPVILAGGLNPDNVQDAIQQVMPYAVDVSSGVERAPGKKDHQKMKEFIAHVRRVADGS